MHTLPAGENWQPQGTDPAVRMAREALLRRTFRLISELDIRPIGQKALMQALEQQHWRNVETFGWREAERMRSEALADVLAAPVPIAEAIDSDFATFEAVRG